MRDHRIPAEGAGGAPLAWLGARWTREEDEELVAAVRAGADLAVIAEQRGRTRVPSCRGCSG